MITDGLEPGLALGQDRTAFMLWTGPLMVLAVIAIVWFGRGFWRRRGPS